MGTHSMARKSTLRRGIATCAIAGCGFGVLAAVAAPMANAGPRGLQNPAPKPATTKVVIAGNTNQSALGSGNIYNPQSSGTVTGGNATVTQSTGSASSGGVTTTTTQTSGDAVTVPVIVSSTRSYSGFFTPSSARSTNVAVGASNSGNKSTNVINTGGNTSGSIGYGKAVGGDAVGNVSNNSSSVNSATGNGNGNGNG